MSDIPQNIDLVWGAFRPLLHIALHLRSMGISNEDILDHGAELAEAVAAEKGGF